MLSGGYPGRIAGRIRGRIFIRIPRVMLRGIPGKISGGVFEEIPA